GPVILTYTFRLPFTLGLEDKGHQDLFLNERWADDDNIAHFGATPAVRIRVVNQETDGLDMWPSRAAEVIARFFGDGDDRHVEFTPLPGAYEQWITLETPSGMLSSEDPEDGGYAFHRALRVFDLFLTALDLTVSDPRVSSVSTHELGPVVFCGART